MAGNGIRAFTEAFKTGDAEGMTPDINSRRSRLKTAQGRLCVAFLGIGELD
jgi:hypothetical protein